MDLPVIDLAGGEDRVVQDLCAACADNGFFYLSGHGIPEELMDSVLAQAAAFFRQPDTCKLTVGPNSEGPKFRGYSPYRAIALDPKRQQGGDTREQVNQ